MPSRRRVLVGLSALVMSAGCLADGTGSSTDTDDTTTTTTRQPTDTATPSETPPPEDTTAPSSTPTPEQTSTATPTPTPEPAATATVRISQGSFEPRRLRVEPNTRVRWVNDGVDEHRIESLRVDDATTAWEYASSTFGRDATVSRVFREPGVYAYYSPTYGRSTSCGLVAVGDATFDGDLPCESGY